MSAMAGPESEEPVATEVAEPPYANKLLTGLILFVPLTGAVMIGMAFVVWTAVL